MFAEIILGTLNELNRSAEVTQQLLIIFDNIKALIVQNNHHVSVCTEAFGVMKTKKLQRKAETKWFTIVLLSHILGLYLSFVTVFAFLYISLQLAI